MPDRHFPVRPNLRQLRRQAKDVLRQINRGDAGALAELRRHHPGAPASGDVKLADAQFALARSYGLASWPRLVLACEMTDAICRDNIDAVRDLVLAHPELLHEDARGAKGNWGPPMSYAANLGRDRIIAMLRDLGATDLQFAFDRACLQGEIRTAKLLHSMGARPEPGSVMGPCETLNAEGLALLFELGADLSDARGNRLAPVGLILQTYARNPAGKHACLEIVARHGIDLPDTAPMAVHRGRLDLLERHIHRDPQLFARTFTHEDIYPPVLGCDADHSLALHGTPLAGATLLHLCVDNDEMEIAAWMLAARVRMPQPRSMPTASAGTLRCSRASSLSRSGCGRATISRGCSWNAALIRMRAPRCGNSCEAWPTSRCTSIATSRRSVGERGFTIRIS